MPHLPHAWECGYLFEVRSRTLLCGDLFTQPGDGARPLVTSTQSDLNPRPVFQSQARDPAKLALVVRNENQLLPERLRRDQCVERTDGFACALQLCAQVCIRRGIARGELEDGQRPEEILPRGASSSRGGRDRFEPSAVPLAHAPLTTPPSGEQIPPGRRAAWPDSVRQSPSLHRPARRS